MKHITYSHYWLYVVWVFFCGTLHVSHLTCCRWGKKVGHMVAIYNLISLTDSSVVFNTSCNTNVASFKEEKASELFSKIKFHSWEFLFREISTRIRICSDCCSWMFSKSLEQTTIPKPEQIQTLQSVRMAASGGKLDKWDIPLQISASFKLRVCNLNAVETLSKSDILHFHHWMCH